MAQIIDRQAARAILLTPQDEILLMRVEYENGDFWITPGGGIAPGETPPQALRRELAEELGLDAAAIGPLVWKRQHLLTLYHRRWRQSEDYFIVPVQRFTPVIRDLTEARTLREFRWWSIPEMRHTAERLVPVSLMRIIHDYRENGPPQAPLQIELVED